MNVGLVAYFTDRLRAAEQAAAEVAERTVQRQKCVNQERESVNRLRTERAEEVAFQAQAEGRGLSAATLTTKIEELDRQIGECEQRISSLESAPENQDASEGVVVAKADLAAAQMLTEMGWGEAVLVNGIEDCASALHVVIPNPERQQQGAVCCPTTGEVRLVRVCFGSKQWVSIPVKEGSGRFSKEFFPQSLKWMRQELPRRSHSSEAKTTKMVFLINGTAQIILSSNPTEFPEPSGADPFFCSSTLEQRRHEWEERVELTTRSRPKSFESRVLTRVYTLDRVVAEEINAIGGTLDLSSPPNDPLLRHIHKAVTELTTDKPLFVPATDPLPSPEIAKLVHSHWRALADAPWSKDIFGVLALLKFNVENKEQARFWVHEYKDRYGFRVRTRDHSWIEGQFFISPESSDNPSVPPTIRVLSAHNYEAVAAIGAMTLLVSEKRDRDRGGS